MQNIGLGYQKHFNGQSRKRAVSDINIGERWAYWTGRVGLNWPPLLPVNVNDRATNNCYAQIPDLNIINLQQKKSGVKTIF